MYITYPIGRHRNYVCKEDDGGGHFYSESKSEALKFSTDGVALAYIAQHPWMKDMFAKDELKLVPA